MKSFICALRRADTTLLITDPDIIGRDTLPDLPDTAIGLFVWSYPIPSVDYGSGTRYVQVQVRAPDGDDAYKLASEILPHLNSGPEETDIYLTPTRPVTGRPRTGAKKLGVDTNGRTTYYFELALIGSNEP